MLNIKKMVLFLMIGVFLIGLSNVVMAANVDWSANLSHIHRTGSQFAGDNFFAAYYPTDGNTSTIVSSVNQFAGISYLRNASDGYTYNGYVINITLLNYNRTDGLNRFGITQFNITLPVGLEFVANSNLTSAVNVAFNNFSGVTAQGRTATILQWNTTLDGDALVSNETTNASFSFNVTSLPSVDGLVDLVVSEDNSSSSFNITGLIYLDGTLPTFDSAKTNDTTHLNVTFSENINLTTVKINSFNVTFTNRSGRTEQVTVSGIEAAFNSTRGITNDTQFTFKISQIEANETPTVAYNSSGAGLGDIRDLAGYEIAANTTVTAADGTSPTWKSGAIDLSVIGTFSVNITLDFDEPMSGFGTYISDGQLLFAPNLSDNSFATTNLAVQHPSAVAVGAINGTRMYITLNFTDQSNISRWRTGVNISINTGFFNDTAGNKMSGWVNSTQITFINDTIRPTIVNYSYTHEARGNSQLLLGFSEAIDIPNVTAAKIRLSYTSTTEGALLIAANLSDASFTNGHVIVNSVANLQEGNAFYTTVNLTLNTTYTDLIAAWDRKGLGTISLMFDNSSMQDLTNNQVNEQLNISRISITGNNWVKDTTAPAVLSATISDVNVTGPGNHRITIQFSENITNQTVTVANIIEKDSTAIHSSTDTVFNVTLLEGTTIWEGYFNFTKEDTNDEWNITVSTSTQDLSGNPVTNESTELRFNYDSEPPYIIYAYYLENGTENNNPYNGTLSKGDTLVLIFNEPLQPRLNDGTNISAGNLTFRDATNIGSVDNNTFSIIDNIVTIIIDGGVPTLNLRGEWVDVINASLVQLDASISNSTRDLNKNSSSWFIRDKADNFATNKSYTLSTTTSVDGPKAVIADYAVEVTQNTPMTISFPTCVNTGNMSGYLPSTSYYTFAKYYNTATWGEHTATALIPLVGYRFTWSNASVSNLFTHSTTSQWGAMSDNILRIYLLNKTDCGPPGPTLTIGDAYNFLAPEGVLTGESKSGYTGRSKGDSLTIDAWLGTSLSGGQASTTVSDVGAVYHYDNGSSYSESGDLGKDWDVADYGLMIYPYTGWWVATKGSPSTTYTFYGTGRY